MSSSRAVQRWTSALEWHGHDAFNRAPKEDWRVDGDLVSDARPI